jgi:hypothetical protein
MLKNAMEKGPKKTIFFCEKCDFTTCHSGKYQKHLETIKHFSVTNAINMLSSKDKKGPNHICSCGKSYKHQPSLSRHKKTCIEEKAILRMDEMIKQNNEFKELLINQSKENKILQDHILKLAQEKPVIHSHQHINQFNLNFFLNEQCKEAITITDFINSLRIETSDLEYLGKNGYVQGISHIFLDGLKKLDINKRPIHCSDVKREILYIKEANCWERDNEKVRILRAIKNVAHKNLCQISQWTSINPKHEDVSSRVNTEYLNIIKESVGGDDVEENNHKIIKLISKEIIIDK